jgi:hypothetical protein
MNKKTVAWVSAYSLLAALLLGAVLCARQVTGGSQEDLPASQLILLLEDGRRSNWALNQLIERGQEPQIREALLWETRFPLPPDTAVRINFALFRLGDKPDLRFKAILDTLKDPEAGFACAELARMVDAGDARYAPLLISELREDNAVVQSFAMAALSGMMSAPEVLDEVLASIESDDPGLRQASLASLLYAVKRNPSLVDDDRIKGVLLVALNSVDAYMRLNAAEALAAYPKYRASVLDTLVVLLYVTDERVRSGACAAMRHLRGNERAIDELVKIVSSASPDSVRFKALEALGHIAPASIVMPLALEIMRNPWNHGGAVGLKVLCDLAVNRYWAHIIGFILAAGAFAWFVAKRHQRSLLGP